MTWQEELALISRQRINARAITEIVEPLILVDKVIGHTSVRYVPKSEANKIMDDARRIMGMAV